MEKKVTYIIFFVSIAVLCIGIATVSRIFMFGATLMQLGAVAFSYCYFRLVSDKSFEYSIKAAIVVGIVMLGIISYLAMNL